MHSGRGSNSRPRRRRWPGETGPTTRSSRLVRPAAPARSSSAQTNAPVVKAIEAKDLPVTPAPVKKEKEEGIDSRNIVGQTKHHTKAYNESLQFKIWVQAIMLMEFARWDTMMTGAPDPEAVSHALSLLFETNAERFGLLLTFLDYMAFVPPASDQKTPILKTS